MNKLNSFVAIALLAITFTACKKSKEEPILVVPPSDGSTLTLNGLIGAEAGSAAGNSVYVDFSKDKSTAVARDSWDLGFYSGADFRVVLNNTTSAGAKVTTATSLAAITEADATGLTLAVSQATPAPSDFAYFDNLNGSVAGTVIPAVSSVATENKVIILNRGTGGGIAARPWIKLRVTRNATGGYTLQYAELKETTNFKTVEIAKDANFNFNFISLTTGASVNVEPVKADWDIVWGYSVYQTAFGGALVPYNFSDLVFLNVLNGVTAAQVTVTATKTYATFAEADIATTTFLTTRDIIGSNWRITQPATGVRTDIFYLVKDGSGNVYKLKFVSMGVGSDAGTRGKPVIEYKLVKKG
ncbi:HmuY family protein [Pedobacter frigiditerrae]|uniref:HmuY family protein n=1 Tax=Pedobacter frigiditerrae TaxID=2530452 RepID=UPI00292E99F9|nr:HmuY family protein [Pedobacter frigiditerrae]